MSKTLNGFAKSLGLRDVRTNPNGYNSDDMPYAISLTELEKAFNHAIEVGGPGTKLVLQGETESNATDDAIKTWNKLFDGAAVRSLKFVPDTKAPKPLITMSPEGTTVNIPGDWSMTQVDEFFVWLKGLKAKFETEPSDAEKKSERIICALLNQIGGEAYVLDGELEATGVTFETEATEYDGWHLSLKYS